MNQTTSEPTIVSAAVMWYDVVVKHTPASLAIHMKNNLLQDGLVQGVDFEWRWTGSTWDSTSGVYPAQTRFSFREESVATFYRLKWQ